LRHSTGKDNHFLPLTVENMEITFLLSISAQK
jgi:hypothetical protein